MKNQEDTVDRFQQISRKFTKPAYDMQGLLKEVPFSRSSVYGEIKHGKLRISKMGRRTIFLVDDIVQWLVDMRV